MIESTVVFRKMEDGELISSDDYTSWEVDVDLVVSRFIHNDPKDSYALGVEIPAVFYSLDKMKLRDIKLHRSASANENTVPVNEMPEFKEVQMMVRVKYESENELEKLWRQS